MPLTHVENTRDDSNIKFCFFFSRVLLFVRFEFSGLVTFVLYEKLCVRKSVSRQAIVSLDNHLLCHIAPMKRILLNAPPLSLLLVLSLSHSVNLSDILFLPLLSRSLFSFSHYSLALYPLSPITLSLCVTVSPFNLL